MPSLWCCKLSSCKNAMLAVWIVVYHARTLYPVPVKVGLQNYFTFYATKIERDLACRTSCPSKNISKIRPHFLDTAQTDKKNKSNNKVSYCKNAVSILTTVVYSQHL